MKITTTFMHIATYDVGEGFYVDITRSEAHQINAHNKRKRRELNAWIYHSDYGIKDYMFGMDEKNTSVTDFVDIVAHTIDEHKAYYMDEYFD